MIPGPIPGVSAGRAYNGGMRLTEFHKLMTDEFGETRGAWILHSHVIADMGATVEELIDAGTDPREVWWGLCKDFRIPPERQLGKDE